MDLMEEQRDDDSVSDDQTSTSLRENEIIQDNQITTAIGENESIPDDQITAAIGEFGPWQRNHILLLGLFKSVSAWSILTMTFMNAEVSFWCEKPPHLNVTRDIWRNLSGHIKDQCTVGTVVFDEEGVGRYDNESLAPCTSWEYDTSVFSSTITSDFDLVCDKNNLKSVGQSVYFAGMIFGVFVFSQLADLFGRKKVLIPLLLAMATSGTITAYLPSFIGFIIGRFFNAMVVIGIVGCIFTWIIESVSGDWITYMGMSSAFFWDFGWLTLAIIGFFIRNWRHLMLATSIPAFASIVLIWLIPESPKWLLATNKLSEAEAVVRAAAKANKKTLSHNWKLHPLKTNKERKANFLDIFTHKVLLMKSLILLVGWFVNSFAYYGLTLNIGSFGGDIFLNFAIKGLLELPAYAIGTWIILKKGRRIPYSISLILCGLSLLLILFIPQQEDGSLNLAAMIIALFGKFCITFSFALIYIYSAELFPTEIRTTGIGCCNTIGRFGGIIAPWVGSLGGKTPIVVFGLSAFIAGILSIFLPETKDVKLPDTIEEAELLPLANLKSL